MLNIIYEYMAEISLPVPFTEEFLSLIPRQRALVNKLMNEGAISSYAVSIEEGKLWMTVVAENESSVKKHDRRISNQRLYKLYNFKINFS